MEDDSNDQAATPSKRRSGARFSLRELLLAMTAICGIAAAFYTRRPFSATNFLEGFRPQDVVEPLVIAASPTHLSFGSSGGGGPAYHGRSATREFQISYEAPKPTVNEAVAALLVAVEAELTKGGYEIIGRSTIGDSAFGFDYESDGADGVVRVKGYQWDDRVEIDYFAHEHQ